MKKGETKKEKREEYSGNDVKRYVGAISEEFRGYVKAVAEQYGDVKRKLDTHSEKLDSHTKILDSHTVTLNSHTEMIAKMMENIEILKGDMSEVKNDLKQKIDRHEFVTLERRVRVLESKVR